jgi:hypothetical protein
MARTLTAANAIITLTASDVFPGPFRLQGFATDDVYSVDPLDIAETAMGVDGKLSGGYVPREVKQTFMLQADSESVDFFEELYAAQVAQREIYRVNGITIVASVGKQYSMSNGLLTSYSPAPTAKKILQPRSFTITWESLSPGPN